LHFAPDTEASLEFVVEMANTDPGASRTGGDELATVEQLTALLETCRFSGRIDHTDAERREVVAVRRELREVWSLDRDAAVEAVNQMLRNANASPYLVRHDDEDWHIHATGPTAPLAERMRVEAAMALVDVIRTNEMGRLRVCAADDCIGLFLDLSRNGSKRYCSVRCGNRVNMIAFRERQSAG
jgi:predicted RNA-binding Zn ribbon-like protein